MDSYLSITTKTMKCEVCEKEITGNTDYYCSFACSKEDVISSLAELYEQYPELEVYSDNCAALDSNPIN